MSFRDAIRKDRQYLYLIGVPNVRLISSASASVNPNKEVDKPRFDLMAFCQLKRRCDVKSETESA